MICTIVTFHFVVNVNLNLSTELESFECFSRKDPCITEHPSSACTHRIGSIIDNDSYDTISGKQNVSVSLCTKRYDPNDRFTQFVGHFWEVSFSTFNNSGYMKGIYHFPIHLFEIFNFSKLTIFK